MTGDDKVTLVSGMSKAAVEKGLKAGDLIREVAPLVGGKGGGRPDMAQGGGNDPTSIPTALEQASLLTGKEVDEAAVMAAVEKAGKARTEIAKLRVKAILMLKETLTDEQREQVHKMMAERFRGRRKERREGMERFRAAGRGRRRDPGDGPAEAGPDGDAPPGD